MNKLAIIDELTESYLLTDNQKKILQFLTTIDADAETILKVTRVSSGRIYSILGELEDIGVIDKSSKKPSIYSMKNFSNNIRSFLDKKLKQNLESQNKILAGLAEYETESKIGVISGTNKEFDMQIISSFSQSTWVKILHKHISLPWFLYVFFDDDDFLKVRQIIAKQRLVGSSTDKFDLFNKRDAYLDLYNNKKVEQIMLKSTLLDFLKLISDDQKNIIKKNLVSHSNVKIHVLESLNTPFSIYLTNKEVLMPVFTAKKQNRMIKMQGSEYVDIYRNYFDSFVVDSTPIQEFI